MRIDTLSTFPTMFDSVMNSSMMRIAQEKDILQFFAHDLRDWTHDKHRTTDDSPYGGGQGLVMKCEPIFEAYDDLLDTMEGKKPHTIFLSPLGEVFNDTRATDLSTKDHLLFICGHYEGIDERAYSLADQVISLGDYVLTGGELASMVVIDAVVRKIEGVLGDENSALEDSFSNGLLEYPHYTRPAVFRDMAVPPILLSGDHGAVDVWRHEQSIKRTFMYRPDLFHSAKISNADREVLNSLSIAKNFDNEALS